MRYLPHALSVTASHASSLGVRGFKTTYHALTKALRGLGHSRKCPNDFFASFFFACKKEIFHTVGDACPYSENCFVSAQTFGFF